MWLGSTARTGSETWLRRQCLFPTTVPLSAVRITPAVENTGAGIRPRGTQESSLPATMQQQCGKEIMPILKDHDFNYPKVLLLHFKNWKGSAFLMVKREVFLARPRKSSLCSWPQEKTKTQSPTYGSPAEKSPEQFHWQPSLQVGANISCKTVICTTLNIPCNYQPKAEWFFYPDWNLP